MNYSGCKNEIKKQFIHKELKNSRNNATCTIRKYKNEYFDSFSEKNRNDTTLI